MPRRIVRHKEASDSRKRAVKFLVWAMIIIALAVGIFLRAWYIFHSSDSSDEAVVGLMAREILHGHFTAFYWGQTYGGSAETFFIAILFAVFGQSVIALKLAPVILSAIAAILVWRIALRLVANKKIAILAGLLVWVTPQFAVSQSTIEGGFRGVVMICGLSLLLISLRVLDKRRSLLDFLLFGLATGLGWWSSPEIIYMLIPAGLLIIAAIVKDKALNNKVGYWSKAILVGVLGALVGALPWLWSNIENKANSLSSSNFYVPKGFPNYWGRVDIFYQHTLPMIANLRTTVTNRSVFSKAEAITVIIISILILATSIILSAKRGGRTLAIILGAILFPFLLALSPGAWFWADGRYAVFLFPIIALIIISGVDEAARLLSRTKGAHNHVNTTGQYLMVVVVIFGLFTSITNFVVTDHPISFGLSGWVNPSTYTASSIKKLEANGVRYGYTKYWLAYKLDFESNGGLVMAGSDAWRSDAIQNQVAQARTQAWLFEEPTKTALSIFGISYSDNQSSEEALIGDLNSRHIAYRVVNTDVIRAIIPSTPIPLSEVV